MRELIYRARAAKPSMARPPMGPKAAAAPVGGTTAVVVGAVPLLEGGTTTVGATVAVVEGVAAAVVVAAASVVVAAASEVVAAASDEVSAAALVVSLPPPWAEQRASVAGRTLFRATSAPHLSMTQLVAAPWMALKLLSLQMQTRSVVSQLVVLPTASSMQGRAHDGMSARVWAPTAATRAAATKAYFILTVWWVLRGV